MFKTPPYSSACLALPPYFGGKRTLLPLIFGSLASAVPSSEWASLIFCDAFMGGGSVSLHAKARGFKQVISNDIARRSQIVGEALLVNQRHALDRETVLRLTQELPPEVVGIVSQLSEPVFCRRHTDALNAWWYNTNLIESSTTQALAQLVFLHLIYQWVAFGTSINAASSRAFIQILDGDSDGATLNPKRFTDKSLQRLCQPTWSGLDRLVQRVNRGVSGGSPVMLYQQDARQLVTKTQPNILYLDPPYPGTARYSRVNRVIDQLLGDNCPFLEQAEEPFSCGLDGIEQLLDNSRPIPIWLISHGGKAFPVEALVNTVRRVAGNRQITVHTQDYKLMPHVSRQEHPQEYLIVVKE